jgi:predicted ATPase
MLLDYRSVGSLDFEVGPFTVLFGKNNAGKTNILEAIYGVLAPDDMPGHLAGRAVPRVVRGSDDLLPPFGAVDAHLEPGRLFDDAVLAHAPDGSLPNRQVSFVGYLDSPGLLFDDAGDFMVQLEEDTVSFVDSGEASSALVDGPRPRPLFIDWGFEDINEQVTAAIATMMPSTPFVVRSVWEGWGSAEAPEVGEQAPGMWRVRPEVDEFVSILGGLATEYLPDFIGAEVFARFSDPTDWGESPSVVIEVRERHRRPTNSVRDVGRGAARWIAAAIQISLHVMKHRGEIMLDNGSFSGHVLFVDEPEAHLHPSAATSIVRWCQKMVRSGFNVIVASHHEEFLRASGGGQTLVHVTRDADSGRTYASTLPSARTTRLLELAGDVGMHPAAALSIRRAIVFVEGSLDEAVLDEYAGLELDSAGVKIVPIHGTRNLEGLVAVELVSELGIKTGILTDATDPATMLERAKWKRSSEEKKVIEVLRIAEERGLPQPATFGVDEADLLFALPADAIRQYACEDFPGWQELVNECRESLGKSPADSVNWKAYAVEKYGLRIDSPGGVRELVRRLDLASVPLPSIRTVVDQIVLWAEATPD